MSGRTQSFKVCWPRTHREVPISTSVSISRSRPAEFPRGGPVLLLAVIVLVLFFARELLIPLAFALTLSFLLAPAVARLEKQRIGRIPAVALVGAIAFGLLCGVGYVVARQLLNVADTLPAYRLNLQQKMASVHSSTEQSVEKAFSTVEGISADLAITTGPAPAPNAATQQPQPVRVIDPNRSQLQATAELLMRVLRPAGTIAVIIVFTIYMLMKREDLRNRLLLLAGMGHINLMSQALQEAATRISQYLVMQVAVNAAYGLLFGSGLYLIGIPDATLWGAIAAILRIIPYVGTATSIILPLIVSVAISNSWWPPLLVMAIFLVLELSTANFVEPWLYSSRTGISSLALLVMAIFWALLWGWPGLILSTPLTVCMVVLGRYVPQMSFLQTLLGTDAELSADAHFYERLLALDQKEAHAIADRFLEGKPLVELYDCVLIPALSLAEQDRHQGALDEVRSNYLFLSIGELVAELSEYRQRSSAETTQLETPELRNATTHPGAPLHIAAAPKEALLDATLPYNTLTSVTSPALIARQTSPAIQAGCSTSEPSGLRSDQPQTSDSPVAATPCATPNAAEPAKSPINISSTEAEMAAGKEFAIICISVSDQADELTTLMLAQLMERANHPTLLLSANSVSSEILDTLAKEPSTVVFISALPPFAFSQARTICQRVRSHLPHNRICIGFWNTPDDPEQTIERFGNGRPNVVVNTLAQALQQVAHWQTASPSSRSYPHP